MMHDIGPTEILFVTLTVGRLLCRSTVNFVDPRITRRSLTGSSDPITYILKTVESTGPPTVATGNSAKTIYILEGFFLFVRSD